MNYDDTIEQYRSRFADIAKTSTDYLHYDGDQGMAFLFVMPSNLWAFILYCDMNITTVMDDLRTRGFQVVYGWKSYDVLTPCSPNDIYISSTPVRFTHYAVV